MNILEKYGEQTVFGEGSAVTEQCEEGILVKNRTYPYASLGAHIAALLGALPAYRSTIRLKLKKGAAPAVFALYHKMKVRIGDKDYTGYDGSARLEVNDREWTEFSLNSVIPDGCTAEDVIAYFIENTRKDGAYPDVIVGAMTAEEGTPGKKAAGREHLTPICRQEKLTFGAIRWDAYFSTDNPPLAVSNQVAHALSPACYHSFAPYFSRVNAEGNVEFPQPTQEQFDEEAKMAWEAGIDYFAYCWYRADDPMSYARKQHLRSPYRDRIRMCAIIGVTGMKDESFAELAEAMKSDAYFRIDGRPVLFVFDVNNARISDIECTVQAAKDAGIGEPLYIVGMNAPITPFSLQKAQNKGCDAVSEYSFGPCRPEETYASLAGRCENELLSKFAYSGKIDVLPHMDFGRDTRPRIERPTTWANGIYGGCFAYTGTSEEIYQHTKRVLALMREHPEDNRPNSLLAYAWNEHDEGGWCCPTLTVDEAGAPIPGAGMNRTHLDAAARALREYREAEK